MFYPFCPMVSSHVTASWRWLRCESESKPWLSVGEVTLGKVGGGQMFGCQYSKGSMGQVKFFAMYFLFQVNPRVMNNGVVFPRLSGMFILSLNYIFF